MHALIFALSLFAPVASQDLAAYDQLCAGVGAEYDSVSGGFVTNDRMPSTSAVELAFRLADERSEPEWQKRALRTVDWALTLYDSVGGGFYDSQKDIESGETSFSKHSAPNGERFLNLLDAWRASGNDRYRKFADRIIDYADRILLDGRGGFVDGQVGDRQTIPQSNGVMIRAWLAYAAIDGDPKRRAFAWLSLDRLWAECWIEGPGFVRRDPFGELTTEPQLMDQIEMGRAYVWAAHLAGREIDLTHARKVGDLLLDTYAQDEDGFHSSALMGKNGKLKLGGRKSVENARAVRFLAELAAITGEAKYRDAARLTASSFEKDFKKSEKLEGADWALALRALQSSDLPARTKWKEPPVTTKPAPKPTTKSTVR